MADKKQKSAVKLAMRGRGNRYYAFRNISRMKSMQRFKALFLILSVLSIFPVCVGFAAFGMWLIINLITFFVFLEKFTVILNFGAIAIGIGAVVFVLSLALRILIERIFFHAEKRELKKIESGADKYLAVMRANVWADIVNLGKWILIAGVFFAFSSIDGFDMQSKKVVCAIGIISVVILIVAHIFMGKIYNRVAQQIEDIKTERRKNAESNTQF